MTLTTEEAQQIAALRKTLGEIGERLTGKYITETVVPSDLNLYNLGKFREAVDQAESGLFRVLNVGNAYMHCEACGEALEPSQSETVMA